MIYQDEAAPEKPPPAPAKPIPNPLSNSLYTPYGWFYDKDADSPIDEKINWYFEPRSPTTVSELSGVTVSFNSLGTLTPGDALFIVIYTNNTCWFAPAIVNPNPINCTDSANWYRSRNVYVFPGTMINQNTNYLARVLSSATSFWETSVDYVFAPASARGEPFSPNDIIKSISIQTNSGAVAGAVELVVSKLNIIYNDATHSFLLLAPE